MVIAYFVRKTKLSRNLLLISIIAFYFFSNRFICDEFVNRWEVDLIKNSSTKFQFDVGIVLTGDILSYDYYFDRLVFREQADRLLQAIDLYRQGKIKKILLTGGSGQLVMRDQMEAAFMRNFALKIGIPENDILIDSSSDNTYQNAVFTKRLLNKCYPKPGKYLLITSAMHMRRSFSVFTKAGIDVVPYSTSKTTRLRIFNFDHLFLPHLNSFEHWSVLIHEWIGYLVYRMMGYL